MASETGYCQKSMDCSEQEADSNADLEVPGNLGPGQVLIDFVRIQDRQSEPGVYDGICW